MTYIVSSLFHNTCTPYRVLVRSTLAASHLPVYGLPFAQAVSHGGGLVTVYRYFGSLVDAQEYQAFIQRDYARRHDGLPACYVQAVLSFYNGSAVLPSVSGQFSLF